MFARSRRSLRSRRAVRARARPAAPRAGRCRAGAARRKIRASDGLRARDVARHAAVHVGHVVVAHEQHVGAAAAGRPPPLLPAAANAAYYSLKYICYGIEVALPRSHTDDGARRLHAETTRPIAQYPRYGYRDDGGVCHSA